MSSSLNYIKARDKNKKFRGNKCKNLDMSQLPLRNKRVLLKFL